MHYADELNLIFYLLSYRKINKQAYETTETICNNQPAIIHRL